MSAAAKRLATTHMALGTEPQRRSVVHRFSLSAHEQCSISNQPLDRCNDSGDRCLGNAANFQMARWTDGVRAQSEASAFEEFAGCLSAIRFRMQGDPTRAGR